jgi:hypothetical protein
VADLMAAVWRIRTYNHTVQGTFIVCLIEKSFSPFFIDLLQSLFNYTEHSLRVAQMLPYDLYHKKVMIIVNMLLDKGSIPYDQYECILGNKIAHELIEKNIFIRHYYSNMVTFKSTAIARFCKEKLALWKKYNL